MKHTLHNQRIIDQVPPDYYQKGVKNNIFQKYWHTKKLENVLQEISFYPSTILDVGCASGWFLSQINKKYPKSSCYGIDIYKEGISYGKKRYKNLNFSVSDAQDIPFKSSQFDLVVCTEVLEHVESPQKVLLEIKRVLSKNGVAIVELDSGSLLFSIVWYLWKKAHGRVWEHAHLHSFSVKELEKDLTHAGFEIIRKRRFNFGMAMIFTVRKK